MNRLIPTIDPESIQALSEGQEIRVLFHLSPQAPYECWYEPSEDMDFALCFGRNALTKTIQRVNVLGYRLDGTRVRCPFKVGSHLTVFGSRPETLEIISRNLQRSLNLKVSENYQRWWDRKHRQDLRWHRNPYLWVLGCKRASIEDDKTKIQG